ncbi:MAG: hypothetical protein JWO83_4777 [Caulobacteraceae bacterium]|jgi:uncharacterized protein YigA (DUF484 family)|nr:hypothetical protein [Caulobacteraceae bacterium]
MARIGASVETPLTANPEFGPGCNRPLTVPVLILSATDGGAASRLVEGTRPIMSMDANDTPLTQEPSRLANMEVVRGLLVGNPYWLRGDPQLLADLGLRLDAANIVDFGPVALSRVSAAHERESSARKRLETMARANFAAQTQTHAAVIDVLRSESLADLARRVNQLAQLRFGLAFGGLAVEGGETPSGWVTLVEGQADLILGEGVDSRLGRLPTAAGLFGGLAPVIESAALARLAMWGPERQGVIAFGSIDADAFTPEMGAELVVFLAKVVERTAERWPRP